MQPRAGFSQQRVARWLGGGVGTSPRKIPARGDDLGCLNTHMTVDDIG